jgi:hypothetical protein
MYCWKCGTKNPEEGRFCVSCGSQLMSPVAAAQPMPAADTLPPEDVEEQVLWSGRPVLAGMESFSVLYELTNQRLRIHKGIVGRRVDDLELVRIMDIRLEQDLINRAAKSGDLILSTSDADTPIVRLNNVHDPDKVLDLIRRAVREEQQRRGVRFRESL